MQISDNEIYLLIKYIKSVLWRVARRLPSVEDARCPKVNIELTIEALQYITVRPLTIIYVA